MQARQGQITLQQAKEHLKDTKSNKTSLQNLSLDSQFMNTVSQVYSKLFDSTNQSCTVKNFPKCPYMGQRRELLSSGSLASVFVTILHKATLYAMLDRHPLDSGLLHEEYTDVYGIDLGDYRDLELSLTDGRFRRLYDAVVKRAMELAGIPSTRPFEPTTYLPSHELHKLNRREPIDPERLSYSPARAPLSDEIRTLRQRTPQSESPRALLEIPATLRASICFSFH